MENNEPKSLVEFLKYLKKENVPEKEYSLRIDRFLTEKTRSEGIPFSGQFELIPFCNLDCKMCYVHIKDSQLEKSSLLTVEQWKYLIDQAIDAGMRRASLTGGECLLYPGFDDIYLYLLSHGIRVTVLTNGVLLNSKRIEFFKENPPFDIQITLYGSCNEVYKQVTGHAVFDVVWNNILLAKENGLNLALSITPNRFMETDAEQLVEKVHSLGFPYLINFGLFEPRENTGRRGSDIDASIDTYVRMHKKKRVLEGFTCIPLELSDLPNETGDGESQTGIKCGAGMNSFQISWNGEMFPCTNLRLFHTQPLTENFKTCWEKLNHAVKNIALPVECHGCPYEPLCGPCIVPHIQNGKTDKCNVKKCQSMKQYVLEGVFLVKKND